MRCESVEEAPATYTRASDPGRWRALADRVLAGEKITAAEAESVLNCPDEELLDLMGAVYEVRRKHHGKRVQLYFL
ncbi:MAG TPA: biotin synthase BioB, partial [Pirellulales bacterium]